MSKEHYSIHQDLGCVSVSKFISYEKGWRRMASMPIEEVVKKLGLENK